MEDAIEEIDSLLVSANKTISEDQKKLVLESLTKNSTSLGVQILFDVVVQWRSFDSVQLTKMVRIVIDKVTMHLVEEDG